MESSVGTMVQRATEVLTIMSSAMSGENIQDVPLQEFATTFLAEAESLLNTQHEDRYLFAGSQRSEEHTSELQSLMRISYAVFCLKKKKNNNATIPKQDK